MFSFEEQNFPREKVTNPINFINFTFFFDIETQEGLGYARPYAAEFVTRYKFPP